MPKQKEFLLFHRKPETDVCPPLDFQYYDLVAGVKAPDIRYVWFCSQNTDVLKHGNLWEKNPTTLFHYKDNLRSSVHGDVVMDVASGEYYYFGREGGLNLINDPS